MKNKTLISFASAMIAAREGHRVSRLAWHDGTWVTAAEGCEALPADKFWNRHSKAHAELNGGVANVRPYMLACLNDEIIMGWVPGTEEIQTDDWFVMEESPANINTASEANGIADGKAGGVREADRAKPSTGLNSMQVRLAEFFGRGPFPSAPAEPATPEPAGFNLGDTVRHATGGPEMVVTEVLEKRVGTQWYDPSCAGFLVGAFSKESLKLTKLPL